MYSNSKFVPTLQKDIYMQQILVILSADAESATISNAVDNNFGSLHSYLAPTVLLVDGDQNVRDALNQAAGVLATLSDDDTKAIVTVVDVTQLDIPGMATLLGNTLGLNVSFDESIVLAVSGWMYSLSQQYADKKIRSVSRR